MKYMSKWYIACLAMALCCLASACSEKEEQIPVEVSFTEPGEFDISALRELPYIIRDQNNNDVTDQYYLQIEGVGLRVNKRVIEICSASAKREYNGEALTDDTVTISMGSLISGHKLTCEVIGSITDVGQASNTIDSCVITDQSGKDVTHCYRVLAVFGTLEVTKGSIV
jgi:hypothetical protein